MACGLSWHAVSPPLLWPRTRFAASPFQGMPADFIKGADISTLLDAEKHGATFYDQNNQRKDPIAILKENGVNYISPPSVGGAAIGERRGHGGGNNDLATTLALAKRAKARVKLLLDFHYSDFWTDPASSSSRKPGKSWIHPQLKTAIHDYTAIPSPALSRRACCRIWCRSATKSTAASCGFGRGKAGGRAAESSTGWLAC